MSHSGFGLTSGTTMSITLTLERAVSRRQIGNVVQQRLFRSLSIKQILEMSNGDIKDSARDISTNLQPSLPEQFAIEKLVADLKMPRSSLYRTVMFGLTSGRTLCGCAHFNPQIA